MKTLKSLLVLSLIVMLSASCSTDDKDPEVVFTAMTANKINVYIDEPITINIEGTGYTEVNLSTSNSSFKITKVTNTIYEISSTEATNGRIYAEMKNNSHQETKSIYLNIVEHGVKNFKTIDGITVDVDKTDKVISLLGEPDYKTTATDGLMEYWKYLSKGLEIYVVKSSGIVNQINMKSSNFFYINTENVKTYFTNYPYEIGNSWKINSTTTTMDAVITQLGVPSVKNTPAASTLRYYQYSSQRIVFGFYSDAEDDYTGKKIVYFSVY